jgi:hypothetical protein
MVGISTTLQCIVNEMSAYLNEPFNYTIDDVRAVSVVIKTSANEQMQLTNAD